MIVEAPEGVGAPIYRRVIVGYVARGPNGHALCLECGEREVRRGSRFCDMGCRLTHRRRERGPKPRFLACPACGAAPTSTTPAAVARREQRARKARGEPKRRPGRKARP